MPDLHGLGLPQSALRDVTIDYEPLIYHQDRAAGALRYNDIRFSGSIDAGLSPMEIDVSVTTLLGTRALTRPLPSDESPVNAAARHAENTLSDLASRKWKNLPTMIIPGSAFYPFILSSGGLLHSESQKLWSRISRKLPPGAASIATDTISIGLVRRRVKAILATEGPRAYLQAGTRNNRAVLSDDGHTGRGYGLGPAGALASADGALSGLHDEEGMAMDEEDGSARGTEAMDWTASLEERTINEGDVTVMGEVGDGVSGLISGLLVV